MPHFFFSPKPIVHLRPDMEGQKEGSNRIWDAHSGRKKFSRQQKNRFLLPGCGAFQKQL